MRKLTKEEIERWDVFKRELDKLFEKYGEKVISKTSGKPYERIDTWKLEEKTGKTTLMTQLAIASYEFLNFLKQTKKKERYWLFGKYICRRR